MKVTPGTRRGDKEKSSEMTKGTSEQPKTKPNKLKIPKSVTDDPAKHRYQRTVRPISNGHITEHSFTDDKGEYQRHEEYSENDPFEGDKEESSNTFGHVKGLA